MSAWKVGKYLRKCYEKKRSFKCGRNFVLEYDNGRVDVKHYNWTTNSSTSAFIVDLSKND